MVRSLLLFSVAFLIPFTVSAQQNEQDVFVPISKYIEQGSAENLSAWFADNLELDILGSNTDCSKNQAKQILRNFFVNYSPKSFAIVHKSGNHPIKCAVGYLTAGGDNFRVTVYVRTTSSGNNIQQIKIEKE